MPHHFKVYYQQWRQGPREHIHSKPIVASLKRMNGVRSTLSRTQGYMLSTPKSSTK